MKSTQQTCSLVNISESALLDAANHYALALDLEETKSLKNSTSTRSRTEDHKDPIQLVCGLL